MSSNEATSLESRVRAAEHALESTRGLFAAFAAVATGGILISALVTPFTTSTDPDEPSTATLFATTGSLMDRSGHPDFGWRESVVMYETMFACVAVIVAVVSLVFIAARVVSSVGVITVRVIGIVLLVTTVATYVALITMLGATDDEYAQGPAIWLLLLGAVLYGILTLSRRSAELWGADRPL